MKSKKRGIDLAGKQNLSCIWLVRGLRMREKPGDLVRDLMVAAVESRFGNEPPDSTIEWLTDNGSPYVARDTRRFARVSAT